MFVETLEIFTCIYRYIVTGGAHRQQSNNIFKHLAKRQPLGTSTINKKRPPFENDDP